MTDVLIVDDHPVVLRGFRVLLEDAGLGRVCEATDTVAAIRMFHKHRPAIVVIDLSFQDRDLAGLSLIRRIRALAPDAHILAFSMHDDPVIVARALQCGALGYITKDATASTFLEAIDATRSGRSYLAHRLALEVATLNVHGHGPPISRLDARELQILTLLSKGKSYRSIADELSVSYRTVIGACSGMRRKLGVQTLAELVHVAVSQSNRSLGA